MEKPSFAFYRIAPRRPKNRRSIESSMLVEENGETSCFTARFQPSSLSEIIRFGDGRVNEAVFFRILLHPGGVAVSEIVRLKIECDRE